MARRTGTRTSPELEGLAERVRSLLRDGESQADFAARAGVSQAGLSGILRGAIPGIDVVIAIANAGGVSVEWLALGIEQPGHRERKTQVAARQENPLDYDLLRVVIEVVEKELKSRRKQLSPEIKAEVFALAYAIMRDEEDHQQGSDKIVRLARLAG
jgi:transcriptional regulator with XRE-family HTH domain